MSEKDKKETAPKSKEKVVKPATKVEPKIQKATGKCDCDCKQSIAEICDEYIDKVAGSTQAKHLAAEGFLKIKKLQG